MINEWRLPLESIALTEQDVHVWKAELDLSDKQVQTLFQVLSTDEQVRAEKFRFKEHCNRFVVARATLRLILGQYLQQPPQQLHFLYSDRGKPSLAPEINPLQLQFNVSHSGDLALYGVTCDRKIGIDVEYLRPMPDATKLATRFFSSQEATMIQSLSPPAQQIAFFRAWTGKEAYLKATGDGLAGSLDQVEVTLKAEDPVALRRLNGNEQAALEWRLVSIAPHKNYIASLAVLGHNWQLSCWQW